MTNSDYYIQDNSDIEDKKLEAAKGLYQSGNYQGALKLYLDMVNTAYSYKLNYEIGRCYYKLNEFDSALTYFFNSVSLENYKNQLRLSLMLMLEDGDHIVEPGEETEDDVDWESICP